MYQNKEKATTTFINQKIKKKIKKIQKEGIDKFLITTCLRNIHEFTGVYSQDELSNIRFIKIPFSIVVNIDYNDEPGSHWLVIRVNRRFIEIYDSLGFESKYFTHYPKSILSFIARFKLNKSIICTPVLQPIHSKLCGLYCIFFILNRQYNSFANCLSYFSENLNQNDHLLIKYFR